MKHRVFLAFAIIVVLAFGGFFYIAWPYRGLVPNIVPPPAVINSIAPTSTGEMQPGTNTTGLPLKLPDGFSMNVFAKNLGTPRVIQLDPKGVLFASVPDQGKIFALPDENRDGVADTKETVLQGLDRPHGFDFDGEHDGRLFVGETKMLSEYKYLAASRKASDRKERFALPAGGRHWTKTVLYEGTGIEGDVVYVSSGSSCDVCKESDDRRAVVLSLSIGEEETGVLSRMTGLRNAVFMAMGLENRVWVTEMGRDFLGDNLPPDEINILEPNKDYGWPYCYGNRVQDKSFDGSAAASERCRNSVPAHIELPAHSAPLGLAFIPAGKGWPKEYEGNLLVAYHGSWNRTVPTGYAIRRFVLDGQGDVVKDEDFVSGWLTDKGVLGRPVDLKFDNDGTLFISDDRAGFIYRVTPPKR